MSTPSQRLRTAIRWALLPAVAAATGLAPPAVLAQESSSLLLEEIIVTARKQEENIQEVPLAITAIGAGTIERLGLQSLSDISKLTAGLVFDDEFNRVGNRPVIRGQANILGNSGVAYFIDGVYIPGSIAAYDLNDVQRIEIVKGPQSALYGRNTYSGAINMITKSPGDIASGNLKLEAVEDDQYEIAASIRGPLVVGKLGGGLTARYYESGGAFQNTFDNTSIGEQKSASVSGVLEFTPTDSLQIRARAYYAELDDGQPPLFSTAANDNNCFFDNGALYRGNGRYYCGVIKPRPINSDWRIQAPDAQQNNEDLQTSLSMRWDISEQWSLTSITGYNDSKETFIVEADYAPTSFQTVVFARFPIAGAPPNFTYGYAGAMVDFTFANKAAIDDISQELRLEFEGERFRAVLGGYYFDQDSETRSVRELPPGAQQTADANFNARRQQELAICVANPICAFTVPLFTSTIVVPRDVNSLEIRNQAVFGLVSFDVSDTVSLTLEGRYQEERISQVATSQDLGDTTGDVTTSRATFDSFSPRATINWRWSDNSMLYALYAEGTKPGGFNSVTAIEAGLPTFEEEEVESIEIGSKNVLADGQLLANVALYFNKITGYQLTQNARSNGNTTSATVNAGEAEVYGGELELSYRPAAIDGLAISLNYAYTNPEFTKGFDEQEGVLNDVADDGLVNCSTGDQFPEVAGCQSLFGSLKGKQIPRTAEHQGNLDVELRKPLAAGDGWDWFIGANYSYESSKYSQVHNYAETGDTTLVNARLGIQSDRWSVTLWGRNLTGEDSVPIVLRYADGAADFRRNFVASQRRDTHFGLTLNARF